MLFNRLNYTGYKCDCYGTYLKDTKKYAMYTSLDVSNSQCSCINYGDTKTCDCCVDNSQWIFARPFCSESQTNEYCMCGNTTTTTMIPMNKTTVTKVNVT